MMILPELDLQRPKSVDEAVSVRAELFGIERCS